VFKSPYFDEELLRMPSYNQKRDQLQHFIWQKLSFSIEKTMFEVGRQIETYTQYAEEKLKFFKSQQTEGPLYISFEGRKMALAKSIQYSIRDCMQYELS